MVGGSWGRTEEGFSGFARAFGLWVMGILVSAYVGVFGEGLGADLGRWVGEASLGLCR